MLPLLSTLGDHTLLTSPLYTRDRGSIYIKDLLYLLFSFTVLYSIPWIIFIPILSFLNFKSAESVKSVESDSEKNSFFLLYGTDHYDKRAFTVFYSLALLLQVSYTDLFLA
jgi:hypothetical protein